MNKEELVTPVFSQNELHNDNFTNRTDIVRQNKRASNKYDDNQRGGIDDIKNFSFNPKIHVEDKVALEIFNHGKLHKYQLVNQEPLSLRDLELNITLVIFKYQHWTLY
jgi:hypothetical protein